MIIVNNVWIVFLFFFIIRVVLFPHFNILQGEYLNDNRVDKTVLISM